MGLDGGAAAVGRAMMIAGVLGVMAVVVALMLRWMTGRWLASAILVTGFVSVIVAFVAFSDTDLDRKDDVDEVVRGLGDALSLDDIHGDVYHREKEPGCAANLGLAEDEAWYERNTYSFVSRGRGPEDLYGVTMAYFREAGFTVEELKAPLSGTRGLRAVRDDVAVLIDFLGSGANFTVTAGPCAVDLSPIGGSYEAVVP